MPRHGAQAPCCPPKTFVKFRYDVALLKSEFKEQKQLSASILHGRLVAIVHEIVTSGYSVNVAGVISFTDYVQICYVGCVNSELPGQAIPAIA